MRVELYKREDGRWAWRVKTDNDEIVSTDGGQGYENKGDAKEMATSLFPRMPIVETDD